MNSLVTTLSNLSWYLSGYPAWRRFKKGCRNPEIAQQHILKGIIQSNKGTEFGKQHRFENIQSHTDLKEQIPLHRYEDYSDAILRIARGEGGILTAEPVNLLEPSGGSSGGSKYIPYTSSLAGEFKRGIQAWIFDLYSSIPDLLDGQAYWSISPANELPVIEDAQITVGFNNDSEYLSNFGRRMMNHILAVPGIVSQITDMTAFRYVTLLFLMKTANLRLISIWNPTFLSLLLDQLPVHWDALLHDIRTGEINADLVIPDTLLTRLNATLIPDPHRASELQKIGFGDPQAIWSKLRLISCWQDGSARQYADILHRDYFPRVEIQGKGLLATEGFISFPLHDGGDPVLSIESHYYEFLPLDKLGNPLTHDPLGAHQLEKSQRYAVVITTGGGLYRYQLDDIIEVTGYYHKTPRFHFIGKTESYSDLFGEKLTETFVGDCLKQAFTELNLEPVFTLIAPDETTSPPHYCLYMEIEQQMNIEKLQLGRQIDKLLRQNYHYDYCRNLEQLGELRFHRISAGSVNKFFNVRQAGGQKLGDIKPSILDSNSGWGKIFEGAI